MERQTWTDLEECERGEEELPAPSELVATQSSTSEYADPPSPALLGAAGWLRVFGIGQALGISDVRDPAPNRVRHVASVPERVYEAVDVWSHEKTSGSGSGPDAGGDESLVFAVSCSTGAYALPDASIRDYGCVLEVASPASIATPDVTPAPVAWLPDFRATTEGRPALSVSGVGVDSAVDFVVCYSASTAASGTADAVHCLRIPRAIVRGEGARHCSGGGCQLYSIEGLRGEILHVSTSPQLVNVTTTYGAYRAQLPVTPQAMLTLYANISERFESPPAVVSDAHGQGGVVAFGDCIAARRNQEDHADGAPQSERTFVATLSRTNCSYRRPRPIAALDANDARLLWTEFVQSSESQELRVYTMGWGESRCAMRLGTLRILRALDPVHVVRVDGDFSVLAVGTRLYTWRPRLVSDAGVSAPANAP